MAISRKPKNSDPSPSAIDIEALIAKGGTVATPTVTNKTEDKTNDKSMLAFTLRVPKDLLDSIDKQRRSQPFKVPRQQWILEAIVQRLEHQIKE